MERWISFAVLGMLALPGFAQAKLAKPPSSPALEATVVPTLLSTPAATAAEAVEPGVDGVTVFMKDNPRDHQHFQVTLENLTPLIVGLDFAYYYNRHHDFGLGFVGVSTGTGSGALYHPRYRYHRARFYWDSFLELGGLFGGYKQEDSPSYYGIRSGNYTLSTVTGGDFGLGVDYKSESPWTFSFLLSFSIMGTGNTNHTVGQPDTITGGLIAYPLIGISYGFIF